MAAIKRVAAAKGASFSSEARSAIVRAATMYLHMLTSE